MQTADIQHHVSTSIEATRARAIMERKISDARAKAMGVYEQVNQQIPTDQIAKGSRFLFRLSEDHASTGGFQPLTMIVGDTARTIHHHALSQIASTAGVPGSYLSDLAIGKPWERELAARILGEHFAKGEPASKRYLVRSVQKQVRGLLSDRFRRLDSRPLLDAFMAECQAIGAEPIDGHATDLRVAMKAILPEVFEPVPNEVLCFGLEWGNSDFGSARHSVRAFIYRLWCLNGATLEDALAQVHLGRQLGDDIALSAQTYALDTKTSVSALRDVVRGTLGPAKIEAMIGSIKQAHEAKIDWKSASGKLAKALTKGELKAVEDAFNSNDVINLPAEKTLWRASNAVSWIAGKAESEDRRLELQRLAGQVLNGKADKAA
jgi:hypothetical protein